MDRNELLLIVAEHICLTVLPHPTRVGIDGINCAGKTTFTDELSAIIQHRGRKVIRVTGENFLYPRKRRWQDNFNAPQQFYGTDNYPALIFYLLEPLGPSGDRQYVSAVYDPQTDSHIGIQACAASRDAILLYDGIFLCRPELQNYWDILFFLSVFWEEAIKRACVRQRELVRWESAEEIMAAYLTRYVPTQRMYLAQCHPENHADFVIDNSDAQHPHFQINRQHLRDG
jgi:uridine kinase